MSVLSDRLRQLRGESSQVEMAKQLGIQRTQWIKYETGETSPGAEILTRICRVHACSADWLLGLPDRGTSAVANSGGVAIVGSGNTVRSQHLTRQMLNNDCSKCPYKKKLKALEKLIAK